MTLPSSNPTANPPANPDGGIWRDGFSEKDRERRLREALRMRNSHVPYWRERGKLASDPSYLAWRFQGLKKEVDRLSQRIAKSERRMIKKIARLEKELASHQHSNKRKSSNHRSSPILNNPKGYKGYSEFNYRAGGQVPSTGAK